MAAETNGRRVNMIEAAEALGMSRSSVQRMRQRAREKGWPSPFAIDGSCDLEELRAWARARGFLGRGRGRPTEVDRLIADAPAPSSLPSLAPAPAAPRTDQGQNPVRIPVAPVELESLSSSDREALAEIMGARDQGTVIDLAHRLSPNVLKKLALMGRSRREIAEAERRELENQRSRREVLAVDVVQRFLAEQIGTVRETFHHLPGKLASRLVGKGYDEIYQAIDEELRAVLTGFAEQRLT